MVSCKRRAARFSLCAGRHVGQVFASHEGWQVVELRTIFRLCGSTVVTVCVNEIAIGCQIDLGIPMVLFLAGIGGTMRTRAIFVRVHRHNARLKGEIEHRNEDKTQGAACPGTVVFPSDIQNAQFTDSICLFRRLIYTAEPRNNICGCYVAHCGYPQPPN